MDVRKRLIAVAQKLRIKRRPEASFIYKVIAQQETEQTEKKTLPIEVKIGDDQYRMQLVNGDEYRLVKNSEVVYTTSDAVGPYVLAELFLEMMESWNTLEQQWGRENPGDLIDKTILEVLGQYLVESNTVLNGENREKMKQIIEKMTGRSWDVRSV